jgi:glucose-1-phosphate cytidylyltransferase
LHGDQCSLEGQALEQIAADGQLGAFRHPGFWQCMDTLREKQYLETLWRQNEAPWKTWKVSSVSPENSNKAA